jgi:hypothetical protein
MKFKHVQRALPQLAAALGLALSAVAQPSGVPTFEASPIYEVIDPIVPISGKGILGAVLIGDADVVDPDAMYVRVAKAEAPRSVDVFLSSPDGRYSASWSINVPAEFSGWARIAYPGKAHKLIKSMPLSDIAALASDGERVFPIRWSEPSDSDVLMVMINSERSSAYAVERIMGQPRRAQCQQVRAKQTLRYDRVCRIQLSSVTMKDDAIEIRRRQSGTVLPSLTVRLDQ